MKEMVALKCRLYGITSSLRSLRKLHPQISRSWSWQPHVKDCLAIHWQEVREEEILLQKLHTFNLWAFSPVLNFLLHKEMHM